jgi:hypothetical protein
MQWSELRQQYPGQWLLVEAIEVHIDGDQRILDDLSVLQPFRDINSAINRYQAVRRKSPFRELYVVHTDREVLQISEAHLLNLRMVS